MEVLPDESVLVASCQAGRLDDFDPLYRHYVKPLYSYVYRRTLVREIAEDITSAVFIKALEKVKTYSPSKGPFSAWLYGIARNAIIDHYRSHRPHTDIEDVWDLRSEDDPMLDADVRLNAGKVRDALKEIDPAKREIILLRFWDGLSYKEIASLTGKSEVNCKVIVSRTLKDLKSHLPLAILLLCLVSPFRP